MISWSDWNFWQDINFGCDLEFMMYSWRQFINYSSFYRKQVGLTLLILLQGRNFVIFPLLWFEVIPVLSKWESVPNLFHVPALNGVVFFPEFGSYLFRAYDRAAIKFRGVDADINFNLSDYEEDMKQVGILFNHKLLSFSFFLVGWGGGCGY